MSIIRVGYGDFTMLKYIESLSAADLERTVGFHRGRLAQGFLIVALGEHETLEPSDFELKASTRWSGGAMSNPAGADIRDILAARGQDPEALKRRVAAFFARRGGNTPAKVLPNRRDDAGCHYPDAEALGPGLRSGVPQFHLKKESGGKAFVVVRAVGGVRP
ncbi:MAG: hypothetical protein HY020_26670 [Burkholderiales bacterium]|nr:hypothetical protein [Burkholderiales bacterium]